MANERLTGIDECRSPEEKEFASALAARANKGDWYGTLWFFADYLIASVDVIHDNLILRTLRADFYGSRVVVGVDPTYQLVTDLDPESPGVYSKETGIPTELAQFVADWLEAEMRRPIDRLEWPTSAPGCILYVLADSGKGLVQKGFIGKPTQDPERRIRIQIET